VYYVKRNNKLFGPFDADRLDELFQREHIKSDDLLSQSKKGPWFPVNDLGQKSATIPTAANGTKQHHSQSDNSLSGYGIVYILVNSSMAGMVKIGKTSRSVRLRVSELKSTGVPTPFECFSAAYVEDMDLVEDHLHSLFSDVRVNKGREFFEVDPREVQQELAKYSKGDATFS